MNRFITPLLSIIISVGLFMTLTKPMMANIKVIEAETNEYDNALKNANELSARISELITERNSLSPADLERLETILPKTLNLPALMLDIDTIAKDHSMIFENIVVTTEEGSGAPEVTPAPTSYIPQHSDDGSGTGEEMVEDMTASAYRATPISFSVTGTYGSFKDFLADIESSLSLMDIIDMSFSEVEGDLTEYTVKVQVYEFNPSTQI